MEIVVEGVLIVAAFVAGFFVGGKWKARVVREAMAMAGDARDKINAVIERI